MKVAALVPYHRDFCSGQRFRIELWERYLKGRDIEIEYYPFASPALTEILYDPGKTLRKGGLMLRDFLSQFRRVLTASRPDVVYIYREAALLGPALIERLAKRWGVPVIYDLDEPLFVPYVSPSNGRLNKLRFFSKVNKLFAMSDHVLAVNRAIGDHARQFGPRVSIVPMAVDTLRYKPAPEVEKLEPPRICWTGTLTNQQMLALLAEPLRRLQQERPSVLRVVADEPMTLPGVELEFIKWRYDQEVMLLQESMIGVVPVIPSVWSPWKFFFKTIQFMSLGLPVVASPIGSNLEIIEDGVNGFLAKDADEWHTRLRQLLDDAELRQRLGKAARETAESQFSLTKQIDFLENVFQSAASLRDNKLERKVVVSS